MIADKSTPFDDEYAALACQKPNAALEVTRIIAWTLFWPWSIAQEILRVLFIDVLRFLCFGVTEAFQAITEYEFAHVTSELNGEIPPQTFSQLQPAPVSVSTPPAQRVHYYPLDQPFGEVALRNSTANSPSPKSTERYSAWAAASDAAVPV